MARPQMQRGSSRPGNSVGGEGMNRLPTFSPTPGSQQFYQQVYYPQFHPQIDPQLAYPPEMAHQLAQGRMAIPMQGYPAGVVNVNPHYASPHDSDMGPSPFLPESPFGHGMELPPVQDVSPMMMPQHIISPTEHLDLRNQMLHPDHYQQQHMRRRPNIAQRHTLQAVPRPTPLLRQQSLQPTRSASPHMMQGDIFDPVPHATGSPVRRPNSSLGLMEAGPSNYEQFPDMNYFQGTQGISPARALGPAPTQPHHFSPHHDEMMITPHLQKTSAEAHSSSSSLTHVSSSSMASDDRTVRPPDGSSDDENESPTRGPSTSRAMAKMQLNEKGQAIKLPPRPPAAPIVRPVRPPTKPVVIGGRTSAKFAKVAEDPGVEGVPPGPRSMDRPSPSFACIIGQAILKCKAGGLSLEHIYRYVETAYPYFKTGDGAWRNSVRHNLSIHKMFETIPRTEKFPPGKGGIWIIHEDEKCHWPEENKFIKNFPPTHQHHGHCRQTMHERSKEKEAMDKAAREGKVYVPKKAKKGRKLPTKDDDDEDDMSPLVQPQFMAPPLLPLRSSMTQPKLTHPPPLSVSFDQDITINDMDDDADGEFLPASDESDPIKDSSPTEPVLTREANLARAGIMVPPRFERKRTVDDEDNVFTTKRVRVHDVLQPINPQQSVFDDSFITPERPERPVIATSKASSSAFKTPALINTSSSPGSSPMPPTVTRSAHHPSGLQQAWTQDDMVRSVSDSSPPRPMLDAAFDFQPKPKIQRAVRIAQEDVDFLPSERAPPKTPVTRSSAATDKTPRSHFHKTPMDRTPMMFGSPMRPPMSASALLSTPMWEVESCLGRMGEGSYKNSPTRSSLRSPVPPTSPTRYAILLDSGASPRKGASLV